MSQFQKILELKEEGNLFFRNKNIEKAIEIYQKAIQESENFEKTEELNNLLIQIHNNLSLCYQNLGDLDKVILECTLVLQMDKNHLKCLQRRAKIFESKEKYDEAYGDYSKILELDPKNTEILKSYDLCKRFHEKHGCKHYERYCQILSPCCSKWYSCRHCHNENESHEIDRYKIKKIKCNICHTEQPVSQKCLGCGLDFARYFCGICNFFDDGKNKSIFHCEKCGLCRIGPKEDVFHCDKCGCCLNIEMKDKHTCLEKRNHSNCPICLEDLFTSILGYTILKCGHSIHPKCFKEMLKNGSYKCPLCQKLTVDLDDTLLEKEIENTPMPDEYKNIKVKILCNECNTKSETLFHFYGMKCSNCKSFNTQRI